MSFRETSYCHPLAFSELQSRPQDISARGEEAAGVSYAQQQETTGFFINLARDVAVSALVSEPVVAFGGQRNHFALAGLAQDPEMGRVSHNSGLIQEAARLCPIIYKNLDLSGTISFRSYGKERDRCALGEDVEFRKTI